VHIKRDSETILSASFQSWLLTMPSDDDLLARLNALKQSSVSSLDTNYRASIAPSVPPKSTDELASRFARLGSRSPSDSPRPSRKADTNNALAPTAAPGATNYLEGIAEGIGGDKLEFNDEDEKSLEELLGELNGAVGDRKEWDMSNKEQQDVGRLLEDMKRILPEVVNIRAHDTSGKDTAHGNTEALTDWESIEANVGSGVVGAAGQHDEPDDGDIGEKEQTEEEEADDVISRLMDELAMGKKDEPLDRVPSKEDLARDQQDDNERTEDHDLELPSAPNDLPDNNLERTRAIEDAFAARLAALSASSPPQTDSLGLPSAPSFSPRKMSPIQSNIQKQMEDKEETWCIICTDDATLECLGCDGDLYCQTCWVEGHRGEGAGLGERHHRAVLFMKKKKKKQAAV
jgi:hypothetical protein